MEAGLGPVEATARAASLLGRAVQQQAYMLAFIDALSLLALAAAACLLLVAWLKAAPVPLGSPQPARRGAAA